MERVSPPKGTDSSVLVFLFGFPVSQTPIGAEPLIWEPGVWVLPVPLYSGLTLFPLTPSFGCSFAGIINSFYTEHNLKLILSELAIAFKRVYLPLFLPQ